MQFNETKLAQVIESAKTRTNDARWLRAIDRAVEGIKAGWIYTEHDGYWLVTTEGGTYKVNGVCNCPAATHRNPICKHRAFKRLVELCNETPEAAPMADEKSEVIAALKAAWNRKYAGNRRYDLGYTVMQICGATELERAPIYYLKQLLRALPLADV
jgi:hypothetical protein